jgi:hypothetical protein
MEVKSVIKWRDGTLELFVCALMSKWPGLRIEVLCFVARLSMGSIHILLHLFLSCCAILSNLFIYLLYLVFTRCGQRSLSFIIEILKIGLIFKIDSGGIRGLSVLDFVFDGILYICKEGGYFGIQYLIDSFDFDAVVDCREA